MLCCGRKGGRRHRDTETELQSERGFVEKVDTHRGKPVVDVFVQLILHVGTSPASRAVRAVRFESILHAFLCSRLAQGNTLYRGCDRPTRAEAHPCVAKMTIKCKERNSEARTSVKWHYLCKKQVKMTEPRQASTLPHVPAPTSFLIFCSGSGYIFNEGCAPFVLPQLMATCVDGTEGHEW